MAIALPVPTRKEMSLSHHLQSPSRPSDDSSLSDVSLLTGPSCSLTILKGHSDTPINAHTPIYPKPDQPTSSHHQQSSSRFVASFANLKAQPQLPPAPPETVSVHAVADDGILLPFLDRPNEVEELLFETKANESLKYRLCRVFGGLVHAPTQRGVSEPWDELLEILIGVDRPILDDQDWLMRLESLVMDRSPELWAQLQRCLGAQGISTTSAFPSRSTRYDSWADATTNHVQHVDDSLSPTSEEEEEEEDQDQELHYAHASVVNVVTLDQIPRTYCNQPAGKIRSSSLHDNVSLGRTDSFSSADDEPLHTSHQPHRSSASGVFAMSHPDGNFSAPLADIIEEPSKSDASQPRKPSFSGKFAALRISATGHGPRHSNLSHSFVSPSKIPSQDGLPSSPLPTRVLSPSTPDTNLSGSFGTSEAAAMSTSFSNHRRLSVLIPSVDITRHCDQAGPHKDPAPRTRRHSDFKGFSHQEACSESVVSTLPRRRRAKSFARSFAELTQGDHTSRLSHQPSSLSRSIGHLPQGANSSSHAKTQIDQENLGTLSKPSPSRARAVTMTALAERDTNRIASVTTTKNKLPSATSDKGFPSSPIPGLLPDGRTRHPSGSFESKDLPESIAAFRSTMELSTSPTQSERNLTDSDDGKSPTEGKPLLSVSKKRKDPVVDSLNRTSSPTFGKDLKTSRLETPVAPFVKPSKPSHIEEVERKQKMAGGTGFALGGGFSLAKSGANYKRTEEDQLAPLVSNRSWGVSRMSQRLGGRENLNLHSPPPVHRRPGGFVSLAHEYDMVRKSRRTLAESSDSVFSLHSHAIASSSGSSIASFGDYDDFHKLSSPTLARFDDTENSRNMEQMTLLATGHETPRTVPPVTDLEYTDDDKGHSNALQFHLTPRSHASNRSQTPSDSNVGTPMTSPETSRTLHLTPSQHAACFVPSRTPSIVFPISPNPSVSRAKQLEKLLSSESGIAACEEVAKACGEEAMKDVCQLIAKVERQTMSDEDLLEAVGKRMRLVDHERACELGRKQLEEADLILAEDGYKDRWKAFAQLCETLGVGQYELGMAKRRCGPAIDLCFK